VTQTAKWSVQLPGNWPGGAMATAGDLVFQGRIDGNIVAYDARSGKEVWTFQTGAPVVAPPISYSVDGKQYVTVITGSGASGGGILSSGNAQYRTDYRMPRRVLTFALGGTDQLPKTEPLAPLTAPDDPDYRPNAALEEKGATAFGMSGCLVCHGWNAVGGGSAPDLRVSAYPANREAFHSAVKGALVSGGMPAFPEMPDADIEAIRQYLRLRGHQLSEVPAKAPAAAKARSGAAGSFAGSWEVVIDSPAGKQPAKAEFTVQGNVVTGRQFSSQGSVDLKGTVDGNHGVWSGKATKPFPIKLEFDVVLDGDTFAGTAKTGPFGTFPVTGTRQ
jgi:quinohemoprotein ethanol dehydrogenase